MKSEVLLYNAMEKYIVRETKILYNWGTQKMEVVAMGMKVTYIDHSGFLLETGTANLIFDYFKGEVPVLARELPLVVFVSHNHKDHYNPVVFDWMEQYPDITYVLDKDCGFRWKIRECESRGISLENHLISVKRGTKREIILSNGKRMDLQMLRSTDEGVAFLIHYDGKTIYHGGDLNDWQWVEETDVYNRNMERAYREEIDKIRGIGIDVAFLPMDPRQRENMYKGIGYFLQQTKSRTVFPMHFWGKYRSIRKFCENHPEYADTVVCIEKKGQQFVV
jgi:L-ascorbate metabolism protein UlaG (beta-lactamase superfamily)